MRSEFLKLLLNFLYLNFFVNGWFNKLPAIKGRYSILFSKTVKVY